MGKVGTIFLRKMTHRGAPDLEYSLGDHSLAGVIGQEVRLEFTGSIECIHCGRSIKKTFQQGYCYPCFQTLARCDLCILKPHTCHFHEGTCREPEWAEGNCLRDHVVYLANTTGVKVGITKRHTILERWGDQGALQATILAAVPERLVAGKLEVALAQHVSDKSDWRALLKGKLVEADLLKEKDRLVKELPEEFQQFVVDGNEYDEIHEFRYPIRSYLEKAVTWNFDKTAIVEGELSGIRGQYLFIGGKALNIRKFSGYEIELSLG